MKTKLFTLLLAIMATNSLWAKFKYGNLYYETISSNTAEVVGYSGEPTSVTIPSVVQYNGAQYTVTSIGKSAFDKCYSLSSITIPNNVTHIGEKAFCGCTSLTTVTIPNSVTSIGNYAFEDCWSLAAVTIPNSVTNIGSGTFYDCYFLTSVTIPNSVTKIGYDTFSGCGNLTSVTIPNSVTSIGNYAFGRCRSLTSVTIPNSVKSIGNNAFGGCESLTSITIPNSVTSIGDKAFYNCSFLISATIGNSVTSIGEYVFGNCSSLNKVVCEAVLVPSTNRNAFENVATSSAILYVPDESVDIYKYMDPWDKFGTILPISQLPTDVENVQTIGGMDPSKKKLIRDGQVVIIHNDKSYNIMGQEIK